MKGIIYCRVSSQEQVSGTSLESQEKACREYAEQKGIQVLGVFVERGESATAANRTELIRVLDFCKERKGEVAAFIVWKIDRFARNTTDHYGLQAQLAKYGTTLHSVTEPMIHEGAVGKVLEAVLAGFAQFENDIRKQRCEGGMQKRLAQGIWPWQPPIGYVNGMKQGERKKLVSDEPDQERFYLLQKAFRLYATGNYTIIALTASMNQWGLKTRTGKPMFKQLTERILRDKFYAGILIDPWSGEEHRGKHTPMITIEEYQKIQYIKENFSRLKNIPHIAVHPDFPLRRFVRCVCGERMTASWRKGYSKKYAYYSCNNHQCPHYSHGIPKKELEDAFIALLQKITPQTRFLRLFEEIIIDTWKGKHTTIVQERTHYDQQLKRLEERVSELEVMRMNREITAERFSALRQGVENQIVAMRISGNEAKIDELDVEAMVSYATQFIRNLARQWQDMKEVKQKQQFQRLVLPEGITYDKVTKSFGTAVLSPIFTLSEEFSGDRSQMVAGAGIAPAFQGSSSTSFFKKEWTIPSSPFSKITRKLPL